MADLDDLMSDMEKLAAALKKVKDPQALLVKHMKMGGPKSEEHSHHTKHQGHHSSHGPVTA
jgi:hypothetical protein